MILVLSTALVQSKFAILIGSGLSGALSRGRHGRRNEGKCRQTGEPGDAPRTPSA